jgi:AcrR family transcriptional regulator
MSTAGGVEPKRRGRPRSASAQRAILDAAADLLLAQGLEKVSMDTVAKRAGVSKATIYRWWPTKEALALDSLYHEWDTTPAASPDTGSLRGDLHGLVRPWVRRIRARPYGRVVAALITEAQTDPEFALEYRARFVDPRRRTARELFTRAIERGEIVPETDVDLAIDLIYGPLYHRLLHGHAPLSDHFATDVVDTALAGLRALAAPHGSPPAKPADSPGEDDGSQRSPPADDLGERAPTHRQP